MTKNCYNCANFENNGSNESGEVSGLICTKPDYDSVEEEAAFMANFRREEYRNRYKRCWQPIAAIAAAARQGVQHG